MSTIKIIPEKCIACGLCAVYAPETFDYDDEGIVLLKKHTTLSLETNELTSNVIQAYRKCPVAAIELKRD
ncbi:MAG: ferredoxin [Streptococcaceae bacterium]|nr:ferredoxin [Streptococcaceae bacterium]